MSLENGDTTSQDESLEPITDEKLEITRADAIKSVSKENEALSGEADRVREEIRKLKHLLGESHKKLEDLNEEIKSNKEINEMLTVYSDDIYQYAIEDLDEAYNKFSNEDVQNNLPLFNALLYKQTNFKYYDQLLVVLDLLDKDKEHEEIEKKCMHLRMLLEAVIDQQVETVKGYHTSGAQPEEKARIDVLLGTVASNYEKIGKPEKAEEYYELAKKYPAHY